MSSIYESTLKNAYLDAVRNGGLIDFTKAVRTEKNDLSGKNSIKRNDLNKLFSAAVWSEVETKSGHRKIKHVVTEVVIEYKNHEKNIDPGAAQTILEAVQKHLNVLNNDIFAYKTKNWKCEPDYRSSAKRWLREG